MKKHAISLLALVAGAVGFSSATQAQSAGSWLVKAGVVNVAPQVSSGDLSAPSLPGTKIDVKSATTALFTVTYMMTDNWSAELVMGWPPRHDIEGDGAIKGSGKLGSIQQVSPTLLGQYRFFGAKDVFRPYLGAGVTYASFRDGKGTAALTALTNPGGPQTTPSADSAFGLSLQAGGSYAINDKWFVDAALMKTFIKNKNKLSTGQTIETKLDPLSVSLAVGYRF